MATVQQVVRHELSSYPFILDMLQQDVLNVSAVAEKLSPKIKAELRKEVKITAISMALRRVAQEFSKKQMFHWKFPRNIEISTKSNIYEIAIKKEAHLHNLWGDIRRRLGNKAGTFLSLVEGNYETVFLTNQSNKKILKHVLRNSEMTSERDFLGYLSVNFEPDTKNIPGIYYQITRALAFNDISIQSCHTMGAELILLFKREDVMRAHEAVTNLIENRPVI